MLTYLVEPLSLLLIGLVACAVLAAGVVVRANIVGPYRSLLTNLFWWIARHYARLFHRVRVDGAAHAQTAKRDDGRPLIVIANHTAGVDPVLVAAQVPFVIRWMMADDMRVPWLDWFWVWQRVIFVRRQQRDGLSVRVALEELGEGGVVGIFPEGGLERPPQEVMPFMPGIGLMIRKSGARVLPVWIDGTPQVDPAWGSLWRRSRSSVSFGEVIDYADSGLSAAKIAQDLHDRYLSWTGWPANDNPPDPATSERASAKHPRRVLTRAERNAGTPATDAA